MGAVRCAEDEMTPSKPESLLALVERLDSMKAKSLSRGFAGVAWSEWPRISKAVRELREFVEENHEGKYPQWGCITACEACQLLKRLDEEGG